LAEAQAELKQDGDWRTCKRLLTPNLESFEIRGSEGGKPRVRDFTEIRNLSIQAPAFEILLFQKASEMAIQTDIHLTDALHILYAVNGGVDVIVTNDEEFLKIKKSEKVSKFLGKVRIMNSIELTKRSDWRYGENWDGNHETAFPQPVQN
jgi:hypothetical protein